jgi:uncharacterized membrane protein YfcA
VVIGGRDPGGRSLVASGIILIVIGVRVVRPIGDEALDIGMSRRHNRPLLVAAAAGVGLFTGLLANGGGFLLVPLYLLVFGLGRRQAAGTSLVVIAVLAVPTLATHWALGHIDWAVAGEFALGLLPGSATGSRLAHRVKSSALREAFGWFLVAFGVFFTAYRILGACCSRATEGDPEPPRTLTRRLCRGRRRRGAGSGRLR